MPFTNGNDLNILQSSDAATVSAYEGNDTYVLSASQLGAGKQITISDTQGMNTLKLVDGLEITSSQVANDALILILSNGAEVTLLGAAAFSFDVGGNALDVGTPVDFATFVTGTLGASVPAPGAAPVSGGAVTIGGGVSPNPGSGVPTIAEAVDHSPVLSYVTATPNNPSDHLHEPYNITDPVVKFRVQAHVDGVPTDNNLRGPVNPPVNNAAINLDSAHIDAEMMTNTRAIFSDNSRADLVVEDVRYDADKFYTGFSNADPGDVDMGLYFDPQALQSQTQTSGALRLELIDIRGAFLTGNAEPLQSNTYDTIKFMFNGEEKTLEVKDAAGNPFSGNTTYAELATAIQAAVDAQGLPLTVSLGNAFTRTDPKGNFAGTVTGTQIIIEAQAGTLTVPAGFGWLASSGVPADSDLSTLMTPFLETGCPLIESNIVLDNVGRVNWNLCERLPDYGSAAGDLIVGSMAERGGVEKFNIYLQDSKGATKLDPSGNVVKTGGSWLRSIASTNNELKEIVIKPDTGAEHANLFIGLDRLPDRFGVDYNERYQYVGENNLDTMTLAPALLENAGLIDVRDVDATQMQGDLNLRATITADSFVKYFDHYDSSLTPDTHLPHFDYLTGSGDDGLNLTVNKFVAADRDFEMNIETNAGDDHVRFDFANGEAPAGDLRWLDNQNWQRNVEIKTDSGNDVVELPGDGNITVKLGTGNDVIYTDNQGTGAVFVIRADTPADAIVQLDPNGGVIPLNNNVQSLQDDYTFTGTPNTQEKLYVDVSFLGIETRGTLSLTLRYNASGNYTLSPNALNELVIEQINHHSTLKYLLEARDGAGDSIIIESLIDGDMALTDLDINFRKGVDYVSSVSEGALNALYTKVFAEDAASGNLFSGSTVDGVDPVPVPDANVNTIDPADPVVTPSETGNSDNEIYPGPGDDLLVLGTGANSNDSIVLEGFFGRDTIINFSSAGADQDFINLMAYDRNGDGSVSVDPALSSADGDLPGGAMGGNEVVFVENTSNPGEYHVYSWVGNTPTKMGVLDFGASIAFGGSGSLLTSPADVEAAKKMMSGGGAPGDTTAPVLNSSVPADDSTNVAVGDNIVLNFDEAVQVADPTKITLHKSADNSVVAAAVTVAGQTITIDPNADLDAGESYYVMADAGSITDLAGNAFVGLAANTDLDFTTAGGGGGSTVVDLSAGVDVTAVAGQAEVFVYDITVVGGRASQADGEMTITGFDPAEDMLRFVEPSGTVTTANFTGFAGVSLSEDPFNDETLIYFDPVGGTPGGVTIAGIQDAALATIPFEVAV